MQLIAATSVERYFLVELQLESDKSLVHGGSPKTNQENAFDVTAFLNGRKGGFDAGAFMNSIV